MVHITKPCNVVQNIFMFSTAVTGHTAKYETKKKLQLPSTFEICYKYINTTSKNLSSKTENHKMKLLVSWYLAYKFYNTNSIHVFECLTLYKVCQKKKL